MPAQATANSVIASANRLIDVRHCWRSSSRMAEISVPAWPMPIHQTKFVMSKAQPTGELLPQMPTPVVNRLPTAIRNSDASDALMPSAISQPVVTFCVRTIELILSVTVAKVWPGARYVAWAPWSRSACSALSLRQSPVWFVRPCSARADPSSAGFGFFSAARYVVRGRVLSSPSSE